MTSKTTPLIDTERTALEALDRSGSWTRLQVYRPIYSDLEARGLVQLHLPESPQGDGVPWAPRTPRADRWDARLTDAGRRALGARDPLIVHHARCLDGYTAAWAAWVALYRRAELLPAGYGDAAPTDDDVRGRDVYVLDFSYPRAELERIAGAARSLLVLDHHASSRDELADLPFARFDMERSGAAMAWDHFHGGPGPLRPRPWIVEYVQDRDLWKWELPKSREVSAYLRTLDPTLQLWDSLARDRAETYFSRGEAVLAYERQLIAHAVRRAGRARLPGVDFEVPIVNSTVCVSEVANELALGQPFAIVWHVDGEGEVHYSLRSSREPQALNVAVIARELGGGGHKHAAGFHAAGPVHDLAVSVSTSEARVEMEAQ